MSDSEAINAYRQALERIISVRVARLKTRKQTLKSELNARLTPKGIVLRFPVTTLTIAAGIGWLAGRAIRALIAPQSSSPPLNRDDKEIRIAPNRSRASSPLIQTLKETALQLLINFVLNKTRNFLVNRLKNNRSHNASSE
ncbi:MAG: hypothetical protein ACUVRP_04015 [Chlorobiales bacterium]